MVEQREWHLPQGAEWQRVVRELRLSARQAEVVRALLCNRTIRGAAEEIGISPDTVKTYLKRSYQRLEVSSRVELAIRIMTALAAADLHPGDTRSSVLPLDSRKR